MTENFSDRYQRNIALIGQDGQAKLQKAKVLVVGAGGLGSPVLLYLTAAGVGTIGVCDGDEISVTNLNRQILYNPSDLGQPKAREAVKKLSALNPDVKHQLSEAYITKANVVEICAPYDIVVDCLDNLASRYILNDACVELKKPFVHAGASQFYGQQFTYVPGYPCLRCALPELEPGDQGKENPANGILGATAGFMGSKEALEVIKLILGLPVSTGNIIYYDALNDSCDQVPVAKSAYCICGGK